MIGSTKQLFLILIQILLLIFVYLFFLPTSDNSHRQSTLINANDSDTIQEAFQYSSTRMAESMVSFDIEKFDAPHEQIVCDGVLRRFDATDFEFETDEAKKQLSLDDGATFALMIRHTEHAHAPFLLYDNKLKQLNMAWFSGGEGMRYCGYYYCCYCYICI
jgi:hypothetical protein